MTAGGAITQSGAVAANGVGKTASFSAAGQNITLETSSGTVNQAGGNAEGVAEHALGMMLSLLKRMPETHIAMRAGGIREREAFMGRELAGRCAAVDEAPGLRTIGADAVRVGAE